VAYLPLETAQGEGQPSFRISTELRRNVWIHIVHADFNRVFHRGVSFSIQSKLQSVRKAQRATGGAKVAVEPCAPSSEMTNDLNASHGLASWLLTRDHKRIALLYLATITVFFFVGGLMAVGIRLELATPAGDFVSADTYNKMFTLHGVLMVFLFLLPSIPAVLDRTVPVAGRGSDVPLRRRDATRRRARVTQPLRRRGSSTPRARRH
jgi:hypothetical protein